MGVKTTSKYANPYTPRICEFWKLSQLFPIVPNRSHSFPIVPNRSELFRIVPFRSVSFRKCSLVSVEQSRRIAIRRYWMRANPTEGYPSVLGMSRLVGIGSERAGLSVFSSSLSLVVEGRPLREADADGHVPDVHHLFAVHADDRGIDRTLAQTGKFRSVVATESYADWLACRYGRSYRDVHQHPAGGNVHTSGGVFTLGWAVVELHSYREWMPAVVSTFCWCLLIHRKRPLTTGESPWR